MIRRPSIYYLDQCRQECAASAHERFRTAATCRAQGWTDMAEHIQHNAHILVASYRFYRRHIAALPLP